MIIYFSDRELNILGQASTGLPQGYIIYDDLLTEDVESGVNTFSFRINCNGEDNLQLQTMGAEGNFILKQGGNAFNSKENSYDSLYQIIETEYDTQTKTLYIYSEDAGLELINKIAEKSTLTDKTIVQMVQNFVPTDWNIISIGAPTTKKTYTWDGENTVTERINSIAGIFDCEVFYSFTIERFKITEKNINLIPKRGTQEAKVQLRYDRDISNIVIKKSLTNLATALEVTGKDDLKLNGYSYSYTDNKGDTYKVVGNQLRNITQMARWSSAIDNDGLIVKSFSYDTNDKSVLAGQARAELQTKSYPEVNYEVSIIKIPDGTKVGDRLYIVDDKGELYLEARILKLETSIANDSITATLGEYLIKESGISEQISQIAADFAEKVKSGAVQIPLISIVSSGGNIFHNKKIETKLEATIHINDTSITTQEALNNAFGASTNLYWYDASGAQVGVGFYYNVNTEATEATYICKLVVGE